MRVLVLGSEGMAGHMIVNYLTSVGFDVTGFSRKDLDVEKDLLVLPKGYNVVINCIGVLLPDSEKDIQRTIFINSYLPHYLANFYQDAPVIHISTDCVFDGKTGGYKEYDMPTERHIYGMSKGLGELRNKKDITLRVSIIGPEVKSEEKRSGLFNWLLNESGINLVGYTNALWNGITTLELAKVIEQYLNSRIRPSGIHHPVNDTVSKYQLLSIINEIFDLRKNISQGSAPKPVNKTLVCTDRRFAVLPIREQIQELKEWVSRN